MDFFLIVYESFWHLRVAYKKDTRIYDFFLSVYGTSWNLRIAYKRDTRRR